MTVRLGGAQGVEENGEKRRDRKKKIIAEWKKGNIDIRQRERREERKCKRERVSEGQKEKEGKEERAAAAAGDVTHGRAGVCMWGNIQNAMLLFAMPSRGAAEFGC